MEMVGKRGKKISRETKNLIFRKALESKMPRRSLAIELQKLLRDMGEIVPGEETLMKMISEARNSGDKSLDKPWHMGTLRGWFFPTENLPFLVELAEKARQDGKPLTIREAQWVVRLKPFIQDIVTLKWSISSLLLWWVCAYITRERLCKLLKEYFETSDLDRNIGKYPEEYAENSWIWDDFVNNVGEEVARAFFRYIMLLEMRKEVLSKLSEERISQELVEIEKSLGQNGFERGLETLKGMAESLMSSSTRLYDSLAAVGCPDETLLKIKEQCRDLADYFGTRKKEA